MTVSNQTTEKINAKINRAAVAGMFNPRDVLELVNKYLGKINYILASKIVQHFFNVSEEALSVFIGAKFNPFIF